MYVILESVHEKIWMVIYMWSDLWIELGYDIYIEGCAIDMYCEWNLNLYVEKCRMLYLLKDVNLLWLLTSVGCYTCGMRCNWYEQCEWHLCVCICTDMWNVYKRYEQCVILESIWWESSDCAICWKVCNCHCHGIMLIVTCIMNCLVEIDHRTCHMYHKMTDSEEKRKSEWYVPRVICALHTTERDW